MAANRYQGKPQPGDERYGIGITRLLQLAAEENAQPKPAPQQLPPERSLAEVLAWRPK